MKVNTWKNIDVDVEVDVDIDAVLNEFFDRVQPDDQSMTKRLLPVLDSVTKILACVTDETMCKLPEKAQAEVLRRLEIETARWRTLKVQS